LKLINLTRNTVLAENIEIADTFLSRLRGLLGRENLPAGRALILRPCDSIHTFFMRFSIDAAFVDKENRVIKTCSELKPWRLSGVFFNAAYCVELPSGVLADTHTQEGDTLQLS